MLDLAPCHSKRVHASKSLSGILFPCLFMPKLFTVYLASSQVTCFLFSHFTCSTNALHRENFYWAQWIHPSVSLVKWMNYLRWMFRITSNHEDHKHILSSLSGVCDTVDFLFHLYLWFVWSFYIKEHKVVCLSHGTSCFACHNEIWPKQHIFQV